MKNLIKRIIKRITPEPLLYIITARGILLRGDSYIVYGNESFNKRVNDSISSIRPDLLNDKSGYRKMRKKMAYGYARWKAHPSEFLLMDMDKNDPKLNDSKLTDYGRDQLLMPFNGFSYSKFYELSRKISVYQRVMGYFKRECLSVNPSTRWETFLAFASRHNAMFIKPEGGSYGRGAQIFRFTDMDALRHKYEELIKNEWMVEELIVQADEMARWNESSVNTVRIPSVMTSNGPVILQPFMRAGRAGSIIDNAGGGGIIIPFDSSDGTLSGIGRQENGKYLTHHPDSKLPFTGKVPHYEELIELNKAVHTSMADHKYLGNDYALTKKGWCLIECNWGQFVGQYVTQEGVRKQFIELLES